MNNDNDTFSMLLILLYKDDRLIFLLDGYFHKQYPLFLALFYIIETLNKINKHNFPCNYNKIRNSRSLTIAILS